MNRLARAVRRVGQDLNDLGAKWALVGGMAVSLRVEPRMTRDIDVAVAVDSDRQAEQLVYRLRARGYLEAGEEHVLEQTATGRLATIRLRVPADASAGLVVVDVLFASSGIESEIVASAETLTLIRGLAVPVARTGHLLAMKVLAAREQDLFDARALARKADAVERERARSAVREIVARGFDRAGPAGRDLARELEAVLDRS